MGLENEIERLFHEAQDWEMELVASSALPTYHSNTTAPPGSQNATVYARKSAKGSGRISAVHGKDRLELSVDSDYYVMDRLVLYRVGEEDARGIAEERLGWLRTRHKKAYRKHLDPMGAAVLNGAGDREHANEHALEHLKEEGPNNRIAIKLYDFESPAEGESTEALKVVITWQDCDYILESRRKQAKSLEKAGHLKIPAPGFKVRWPREIELRKAPGAEGSLYVRADLWNETKVPGSAVVNVSAKS